jgi:hypothetical protein
MFRFSFQNLPIKEEKSEDFPLITALNFGKLVLDKEIDISPIKCINCGSILSDPKALHSGKTCYQYECPFCLTLNEIPKEIGDKQQQVGISAADLCFMLDKIRQDKSTEAKKVVMSFPIQVAVIDISGSMGGGKLEAVKHSLVQSVHKLTADYPKTEFILIPFSTDVMFHPNPDSVFVLKDGPQFHNENLLATALGEFLSKKEAKFMPIEKIYEKWTDIIKKLKESNMTALGPALFIGLQMIIQSQRTQVGSKSGGRLLLLTDGLANVGFGSTENTQLQKDSGASVFYHHLGELAIQNNIIVDMVAVRDLDGGNSVALDIIGAITDYTGGSMAFVSAKEIESTFNQLHSTQFVARNVQLRVFAPDFLTLSEIEGVQLIQSLPTKAGEPIPLGAFSGDREIFLKFRQTKPTPTSHGLNRIPIQFQMEYFDAQGLKKLRLFSQNVDIVSDSEVFKKTYDAKVATAYELAKADNLRRKGEAEQAVKQANFTFSRNINLKKQYAIDTDEMNALVKDEMNEWAEEDKKAQENNVKDTKSYYSSSGQARFRMSADLKMQRMKKKQDDAK